MAFFLWKTFPLYILCRIWQEGWQTPEVCVWLLICEWVFFRGCELELMWNMFSVPHLLFGLWPSGCVIINKLYVWVWCKCLLEQHLNTQMHICQIPTSIFCYTHIHTHSHTHKHTHTHLYTHTPEVADFPGSGVEERWGDEQAGETAAIEPGSHAMPLVNRQEVEHWPAHQTWEDPQLERIRMTQNHSVTLFCEFQFKKTEYMQGRL